MQGSSSVAAARSSKGQTSSAFLRLVRLSVFVFLRCIGQGRFARWDEGAGDLWNWCGCDSLLEQTNSSSALFDVAVTAACVPGGIVAMSQGLYMSRGFLQCLARTSMLQAGRKLAGQCAMWGGICTYENLAMLNVPCHTSC